MADDEPTRQVPPGRPRQPVSPSVPPQQQQPPVRTWEEELADRISALKNWLILLAIVTVAATGIAVYALVKANDDEPSAGAAAGSAQLSELEDRVSELENNGASDAAVTQLKSDVADLDARLKKLESAVQDATATQPLDALQQELNDLAQQLEDLQNQPAP